MNRSNETIVYSQRNNQYSVQAGNKHYEVNRKGYLINFNDWDRDFSKKVAELDQLLQPGRRMDPDASRVNGIDDIDLLGKPTFGTIAPDLLDLLDGALIVAHNAAFDAGFVGTEFFASGYVNNSREGVPNNPWLLRPK